MGLDLFDMFKHMGLVAWGVVITLFIMSMYSIAVMIERYWTFKKATDQSRRYAPEVARLLKGGKIKEAVDVSLGANAKYSHLAKVLVVGLQEWQYQQETGETERDKEAAVDSAKRAIQRATAVNLADLKKGLSGLATIGSTAPFVGLFGTTFGIINAFAGHVPHRLGRYRGRLGGYLRGTHHDRLWSFRGRPRRLGLQLPERPRRGLQRRDGQLELRAARLLHQEGRVGLFKGQTTGPGSRRLESRPEREPGEKPCQWQLAAARAVPWRTSTSRPWPTS